MGHPTKIGESRSLTLPAYLHTECASCGEGCSGIRRAQSDTRARRDGCARRLAQVWKRIYIYILFHAAVQAVLLPMASLFNFSHSLLLYIYIHRFVYISQ